MEFSKLLEIVGDEPVFEPAVLLAGEVDPANVHLQLSRWTAAGRIYQLRRGLYALAPPYQKVRPHPFLVANRLSPGSYVSTLSALAYFGLIPEAVYATTNVTAARPAHWETPAGRYDFQHLQHWLLYGYRLLDLGEGQSAYVARPEKALLDLVYLQAGGDSTEYLASLRLQNLEQLDLEALRQLANRADSPKLRRAAQQITYLAQAEAEEYEIL
jgi:predicted transcriptional regulator of viral defense system